MKEKLYMEKKQIKSGFTLIEVITGVFIFSIIFFLVVFITSRLYLVNKSNEEMLEQTIFLEECYELFKIDPVNFKNNLNEYYDGNWIDDCYELEGLANVVLKFNETIEFIEVVIIINDEVEEQWIRKKVIL